MVKGENDDNVKENTAKKCTNLLLLTYLLTYLNLNLVSKQMTRSDEHKLQQYDNCPNFQTTCDILDQNLNKWRYFSVLAIVRTYYFLYRNAASAQGRAHTAKE